MSNTSNSTPVSSPSLNNEKQVLAGKELAMENIPKSTSLGYLKGTVGGAEKVPLAFAARTKSSPSPMARLRKDLKKVVLGSRTKKTKQASSKGQKSPQQTAEVRSYGDVKVNQVASDKNIETWINKMENEEKAMNVGSGSCPREEESLVKNDDQGQMSFHDMLVEQQKAFKQETMSSLELFKAFKEETGMHSVQIPLDKLTDSPVPSKGGDMSKDDNKKNRVKQIWKAVKLTYTSRPPVSKPQTQWMSTPPSESGAVSDTALQRSHPQIQYMFTREERIRRYLLTQALDKGLEPPDNYSPYHNVNVDNNSNNDCSGDIVTYERS